MEQEDKEAILQMFGDFLSERNSYDDLLFFLFVRSILEKELHFSFQNLKPSQELPSSIALSRAHCLSVTRAVFGCEEVKLIDKFMQMLEGYLENDQIDVYTYLAKALENYQNIKQMQQSYQSENASFNKPDTLEAREKCTPSQVGTLSSRKGAQQPR